MPRRLLLVAAIPELIRDVLAIPSLVIAGITVEAVFQVMLDLWRRIAADPERYRSLDSEALQAELQARLHTAILPPTDLAVLSAIGVGAGVAVALVGFSAVTAATLAASADRPVSIAGAFRLVGARGGLRTPIIGLGVGWTLVSLLSFSLQTSTEFQAWAGVPGSPRSVLLGSLLAVLALVVTIGLVVLTVRWALFIAAVQVEALGLGAGLARAAQLTHGIRIRLALAMAGIFIVQALSVGIVAAALGFAAGLSAGSVAIGFGTYMIASFIGNLLWAPLLPAILTLAYRERMRNTETPSTIGT
jgi:hypothetical protein